MTRIPLERAREILREAEPESERWALANTIVSLYQAIAASESLIDDYARTLARISKEAGL